MTSLEQDGLENRLKKLRNPAAEAQHSDSEDDDSPAGELSVQARVDSVALAKGRLSSGAGSSTNKERPEGPPRVGLPPSGANRRPADSERQKSTGLVLVLCVVLLASLQSLPCEASSATPAFFRRLQRRHTQA